MDTESLDFTLQDGRFLHIPSSIDMENQVTIGCAGAVLTHLQRRRATVMPASSDETSSYFQFAFYGIDGHDALKETASGNELPLLQKVDIDSTEEQGRTVVKPGLDRELDKMKDSYDGLSSLLKQVAIDIASTIPESLDIDVNVIYFPQLGFNIAIPLNDRGEATFTGSDDEWELIFVTENRAYFKDFRMREMDEKLEKEIEIVYELAQKVLQYEKVLLEAFVPAESVEMGITDKILVKSNSQDSVSQIQSTFMNDLQQISFDLKQMTERSLLIIDEFGKGTSESGRCHSLTLFSISDTDIFAVDGIGLICGILNHLLIAENAPKVIAATHFHEILENEFLKPGPRLLLGHMEVQVCEESCKAEDQITYLYKSVPD
ncbi:hypothetical protein APSETT444_005651 [Aspergillus pseudonomiae]